MTWPIYVPSKGRATTAKTPALLEAAGLQFMLICEPQEKDAYQDAWGAHRVAVLEKNDQGIAYARNAIKKLTRWTGATDSGWYWMFDDDITGFYEVLGGKCVKSPANLVLAGAQRLIGASSSVAQAALEYQQFAWSAKNDVKLIGYCDVAVAINSKRTDGIHYRKEMELKEDRDFTLQVLAAGWDTMRTPFFAFSAPKNGSNAGGLQEVYQQTGREKEASARMAKVWPGVCVPITKPDGRQDVKVDWGYFRKLRKQVG